MFKEMSIFIKSHSVPSELRDAFNVAASIYMNDRNFFHAHSGLPMDFSLDLKNARREIIETSMSAQNDKKISFAAALDSRVQGIIQQGRQWNKPADVKKAVEKYYAYD